jgi:hypothetical protein
MTKYSEPNGSKHSLNSAVSRVKFVSDVMSYIILRGHCCNMVILNVHAPYDDVKDSFYE